MLLRRAVDLQSTLRMGIRVELNDIPANEFAVMLILEEERDLLDREQSSNGSR